MNIDTLLSYGTTFLSSVNFILAMFIIVLIFACFLGRYIVITKKMVLGALGVIICQIIFFIILNLTLVKINPELYKVLDDSSGRVYLYPDDPNYEAANIFTWISNMIFNGLVFLYAFFFYLFANKEKRFIRAIESLVCLCLYQVYISFVLEYAIMYFKGGDIEFLMNVLRNRYSDDYYNLALIEVCCLFAFNLIFLLILYFGYYKKNKFYIIRVRDRILFMGWFILCYVLPAIPFWTTSDEVKYGRFAMLIAIFISVLAIITPMIFIMIAAERNLKEKNEYQETYLNAELEYIEQYKRTQTETRAFRHDIINNLSVVNMMLDEGKQEEASEHLKELLGNVKALSPSIITGDEMLDCIVAMKADKMKEMNIDFKSDGVVDGGLHMKPMDVCSVFANALDNAIEASSKIEENPWIDMNIKRTEKFFIIKISNSAKEKVNVEKLFSTAGYTSKDDKEHHGFGLRNIRQSVEEYDGLLKAESGDDFFGLSIMIPR